MNSAKERISQLRNLLKQKNIDAWIIPSADSHQSEYVAGHWKCRHWLSGFTGSAGTLVITQDKAGLWTDSRYFLQAEKELAGSGIMLFKIGEENVPGYSEWIRDNLNYQSIVGFDGSLLSVNEVTNLMEILSENGISMHYSEDLINEVWAGRPLVPQNPIEILEENFSGEKCKDKLDRIRQIMFSSNANCTIISALDDVSWIFNIRGADMEYNPVVVAYAFISMEKAYLFIDKKKITTSIQEYFLHINVELRGYFDILDFLAKLNGKDKILLDNNKVSQKLKDCIPANCKIIEKSNIVADLKSVKNNIEIIGFKNAHVRDGVAMVKWLFWMEQNVGLIDMDEYSVAQKLEEFRSVGKDFRGLSFSTIVGYKENGAIVHYTATKDNAKKIEKDGLLLVDSGAQYNDGTTDITRTISLGNVTDEEKNAYTTILKGHIGLSKAVFPKGYTGAMIDTFARGPIWETYYNYGHGTGHGVGHYLNVHEGPHQIKPTNHCEIKVGMVTSNEPGMYLEGKFGIRIENLILTILKEYNKYGSFLGFDTLTLCPYDLNLINVDRLTHDEKEWMNNYHEKVYKVLSPKLTEEETNWLDIKTQRI